MRGLGVLSGGRVLSASVTEAGRALAERLPFEAVHGDAAATVRARWRDVEGFVLFLATGAAVRVVAPLLGDKGRDPGVVCVDEAGRYAVALCGGHAGGANALARRVAELLGCEPVVTTASDAVGLPALDALPGFVAVGDVAGVTRALLDGRAPAVAAEISWPLPRAVAAGEGPERVVVTDRRVAAASGTVALHPPSLVLGVGSSSDAPAAEVQALVDDVLAGGGFAPESVGAVATIDRRASSPGVVALGLPVLSFTPDRLAAVVVPTPSAAVREAVGTDSVAEAAALLGAGPDAELVVPKRKNAVATVAVARRARPAGRVRLVGLGPGDAAHRTAAAERAIRHAEVVVGYGPYVAQAAPLLRPHQEVLCSPIGDEVVRAEQALAEAAAGRDVVVLCSGDPGVYAMASIVLELAPVAAPGVTVEVLPGVTASLAAAALLGAPLGHDHMVVSLSDLLTPWDTIERRVRAAAAADLVTVFYNPRSAGRAWQLDAALDLLREHRAPTTPVGIVRDATRPEEAVTLTSLGALDAGLVGDVGMTTCVVVGSSTTYLAGGRMVTPRGYGT